MDIKKVIIPAAGLETRFYPLSKVVAKALFPLADLPVIDYVVREAVESEISEVIFVLSENKKFIVDYFKKNQRLEDLLKQNNGNSDKIKILKEIEARFDVVSFSICFQQVPKGDGDALLKARKFVKKEPFGLMFSDDVFISEKPVLGQLKKIFVTAVKPVVGLTKKPKNDLSHYGVADVEKIASRLYKIKRIVEKPALGQEPSDLAVSGRFILTPEIFSYLLKTPADKKGEVITVEAINRMIADGKIVYGYEIDGQWLECGSKKQWIKSNLLMCSAHPEYGAILRDVLKTAK